MSEFPEEMSFVCVCGILSYVIVTNSPKHASKIAEDLDLNYDAIVLLSGDGIIHEILNGLQKHRDSDSAFEIPIAPIPTGSANGTSINLLGLKVCCKCAPHFHI